MSSGIEKVLGCRLTLAEWDDFNKFRQQHFPEASNTTTLRVLLQLALTVTGNCSDLWMGRPQFVPDGWFTNMMVAVAKTYPYLGVEDNDQASQAPAKKARKKATKKKAEKGGEA